MKYPRWAIWSLGVLLFTAVFANFLANDRPLACQREGQVFFPIFYPENARSWPAPLAQIAEDNRWREADYPWVVFPPVPFLAGKLNPDGASLRPFSAQKIGSRNYRHWLGTDQSGYDVAAGLVAGSRIAVLVMLTVLGVALLVGGLLGGLAGHFGDERFRAARGRVWVNFLAWPVGLFLAFWPRWYFLTQDGGWAEWGKSLGILATTLLIFNGFGWLLCRLPFFSKKITLPLDFAVMRLAEVFEVVPMLLLLISIAALNGSGNAPLFLLVAVIGLFSWPTVARLLRAELLRVRELDFVQAARSLGFSEWRILLRHALPNAMRSVFVALSIGAAGAVLLEASLAFLGITDGVPGGSWGRLLLLSHNQLPLWWVAVFPGLALTWTVFCLHALGDSRN